MMTKTGGLRPRPEIGRRAMRIGVVTLAAALAAASLGLLPGCGGGGVGTNGTGSPVAAGLSVGTVTGLGSVIVDGVRLDDSQATVQVMRNGDDPEQGEVRLGQRVSLEYASTGGGTVLQRIELAPSLTGVVNERTDDTIGVLGQTVLANDDPTRGPLTVFEAPYTRLADVALGDAIEVHAVRVPGAAGAAARLMATRIEKRSALGTVRVSGAVGDLAAGAGGAQRFRLGGLTVQVPPDARLAPDGARLRSGRVVHVFAAPASFDPVSLTLVARRVEVTAVGDAGSSAFNRLQRAGLVADWSGTGFTLDGVAVRLGPSTQVVPAGRVLGNGMYVRVEATLDATTGDWVATRIEGSTSLTGAELHGNVLNWSSATGTFSVRDTPVQVGSQTRLDLSRCGTSTLTDGLYVTVTGTARATGVAATLVRCDAEPKGPGTRLGRRGTVVSVDLTARRLKLQVRPGEILDLAWNDRTFLRPPLTPSQLVALIGGPTTVEVDLAVEADGTLTVRNLRLHDGD